MAIKGKIYYTDKDFTDAEVAANFKFPCILILTDNAGKIKKQTAYDLNGTKSVFHSVELPDPTNDQQELMFIPTASDAWRNVPLTTNPQWVQITAPFASTLNLIPNAAGREFAGVNTKFRKNGWDGKNIFLRNDSEFDLVLKPTATTAANTTFYTFEEEQVLEAHAWKLFKIREVGGDFFLVEVDFINPDLFMLIADFVQNGKIRADKIESLALLDLIISAQTSIADFAANSGDYTFEKNDLIAVPDGSGKYSFYIYVGGVKTDFASYLAMGISNVTISQVVGLQDALTLLGNRVTANETAIAGKVDKPTTDGIWAIQKLGSVFTWVSGVIQNIANTDLSNTSARIFTQGNTFTWNTAGFFYYLKGFLDKTGNATYTKVVVVHPTTGEMVTRDFADPQATTLAVQNASTSQKAAMRTALLGTSTPASPTISGANPSIITKGIDTYIDLYGLNLTLLDPAFIYIKYPDGVTKVNALQFYNTTTTSVKTLWNLPTDLPDGVYQIYIQNGVTAQGASQGYLYVTNNVLTHVNILANQWIKKLGLKADGSPATQTPHGNNYNTSQDNYIRLSNTGTDGVDRRVAWKSPNILPTGHNDIWSVQIDIMYSGAGTSFGTFTFPLFGITSTSDSVFNIPDDINLSQNTFSLLNGGGMVHSFSTGGSIVHSSTIFPIKLVIEKPIGDKVYMKLIYDNQQTVVTIYQNSVQITLDINYAIFMNMRSGDYTNMWWSGQVTVKKLL